jgi:hypothetical protein
MISGLLFVSYRSAVGTLDLPSEPEEPIRAERGRDRGTDRPKMREMPDPDERGRAYEAIRAHVSAETAEGAGSGRRPDGRYWEEAPGLLDRAAEYRERWQADRQPAPDRPVGPPGSFRSRGGFYLSPERHAEAVAAIGRVREAEPAISADMRAVERENRHGGWLAGFEHRRKGEDRLKEKVAEGLTTIGPDARPEEILQQVPDAIRYTFCFHRENYAGGYHDIKQRLQSLGYEMYQVKNSWGAVEYKGINTRWVTVDGQRFEVQFHTTESFHAKQCLTHDAYERIRNPLTSDEERDELEAFQREVSSWIKVPESASDIPEFKKEGF